MSFEELNQYLSLPTIHQIIKHKYRDFYKFANIQGFPPLCICGVKYYQKSIVQAYLDQQTV